MAADNGTFWLRILRNQLKIALPTILKLPFPNFYRLMLLPFSSEFKRFSLFLIQVDKVFFGKPLYLAAIFLLLILFFEIFKDLVFFM